MDPNRNFSDRINRINGMEDENNQALLEYPVNPVNPVKKYLKS